MHDNTLRQRCMSPQCRGACKMINIHTLTQKRSHPHTQTSSALSRAHYPKYISSPFPSFFSLSLSVCLSYSRLFLLLSLSVYFLSLSLSLSPSLSLPSLSFPLYLSL